MGLRAARDAGIKVEKEVIDKAIAYVKRCQNPDGGFSYMASMGGGGGSQFPRSAAGVCALYYAGVFGGNEIENGLKYVRQYTPGRGFGGINEAQGHYFYGYYYATQCMFLAGGDWWANFFPAIRDELLLRQKQTSGSDHWDGDFSEDYATSMALIIMGMPNRYLPVFAGKGPGS
jgi:prenyltransferase beta subunit